MTLRRLCESGGSDAFEGFVNALDGVFALENAVELHSYEEDKRPGNLKLSAPSNQMHLHFQLN